MSATFALYVFQVSQPFVQYRLVSINLMQLYSLLYSVTFMLDLQVSSIHHYIARVHFLCKHVSLGQSLM